MVRMTWSREGAAVRFDAGLRNRSSFRPAYWRLTFYHVEELECGAGRRADSNPASVDCGQIHGGRRQNLVGPSPNLVFWLTPSGTTRRRRFTCVAPMPHAVRPIFFVSAASPKTAKSSTSSECPASRVSSSLHSPDTPYRAVPLSVSRSSRNCHFCTLSREPPRDLARIPPSSRAPSPA